jgi:hypothetical protein
MMTTSLLPSARLLFKTAAARTANAKNVIARKTNAAKKSIHAANKTNAVRKRMLAARRVR